MDHKEQACRFESPRYPAGTFQNPTLIQNLWFVCYGEGDALVGFFHPESKCCEIVLKCKFAE